ncbi:MAG: ATP-binding cassette domain-containing protein, partial [Lachnospiraceae bacterium]|nr:ATP-binding cassette domain-containing protein [Lachnospiraceae bacterium]
MSEYAIQLKNITKRFGEVVANDSVNLTLKHGEVLSLLGENGSGKTTLMNMLSGIYRPDEGSIFVDGKEVEIKSPIDSYNLHIGMVHQHFKLIDVFTGAENIFLGDNSRKFDKKKLTKEVEEIAENFGFSVDLNKKIYDMSVSEKQTVEILKVLYRGAEILILDEPTAVLTPLEKEKLFAIVENLRMHGKAIILITHKMDEVLGVSDRVTVLRKGKYIDTIET